MTSAAIEVDDREDYGEVRYNALGFLNAGLHSLTFTVRGAIVHAISLRRATRQEETIYAENF